MKRNEMFVFSGGLLVAVVLAMVLWLGTTASAGIVMGFDDPAFYNNLPTSENVTVAGQMFFLDSSGLEVSISTTPGYWRMAFVVSGILDPDTGGSIDAVFGYADNTGFPGPGVMIGYYSELMSQYGSHVTDVWLVHDVTGDGIGEVSGGIWYIGDDDVVYDQGKILFGVNRVLGDVSQLPPFSPTEYLELPTMVAIPEPATLAILGVGALFLRKRLA
jgi:hypothetical protein